MKYKAIWKVEPTFELEEGGNLEEEIHTRMLDLSMNPHDFIEFEEVKETEIDLKFNLQETTRSEALSIMSFLIGFHQIKEDELDFSD